MSDQQNPEQPAEQPHEPKPAEAVGYCRPPVHSRWKKGQSGNPSGRKKGSPNLKTLLDKELSEKIMVHDSDGSRFISKGTAMMKAMVNKAIKGDVRAFDKLTAMQLRLQAESDEGDPDKLSAEDDAIIAEYLARNQQKGGPA